MNVIFDFIYGMSSQPHWRIPSFFRGVGQPPDQSWEIPRAPHGSCLIGPCLDPAYSWQDATNQDWSAWNGTNGNAGASRGTFPSSIMVNTQKAPQKHIPIESSNEGFYLQVNKTWSLVQQFTASPNRVRWWITEAGHVGGPKRWAEFWSIKIFLAVDDIWVLQILTMIWLNKRVFNFEQVFVYFLGPEYVLRQRHVLCVHRDGLETRLPCPQHAGANGNSNNWNNNNSWN